MFGNILNREDLIVNCDRCSLSLEKGGFTVTNWIKKDTTPEELNEYISSIHGYDFRNGGRLGWNVLGAAANIGNIQLVDYLSRQNEDLVNLGNELGMTPLCCAILSEDPETGLEVCKRLLDFGANVNIATNRGRTPLWHVLDNITNTISNDNREGNIRLAKFLLRKGAAYKLSLLNEDQQQILKELEQEIRLEQEGKRLFLAAWFLPSNKNSIIKRLPKDLCRHIYTVYLQFD